MRDTIIGLVVLLSVIGGYFSFRTKTEQTTLNQQSQAAPLELSSNTYSRIKKSPPKISHLSKRITRKVIHESTKHSQSKQNQNDGYHQGSRGETSEVEKLPSIYEDQEERVSQIDSSESTKSVYGVPVNAWVLSHRNSIKTVSSDPRLAQGVRVFVGCVELKKEGAKELTKGDCARIASTNRMIQ